MPAYWFSLTSIYPGQTVDQVVTRLSPLGITLHAPAEQPYYYQDELGVVLKCIGEITVDVGDGIDAWPHEPLPDPGFGIDDSNDWSGRAVPQDLAVVATACGYGETGKVRIDAALATGR